MHRLVSHPAFPASAALDIGVVLSEQELEFFVTGEIDRLLIPPPAQPTRTDDLWRHTCFELFVRDTAGERYREFNFSPSGEWAAYAFDGYRAGMRDAEVGPPVIRAERHADRLMIAITLPPLALSLSTIGMSAVLEELNGAKSYWALAHPPGKPDFHDPACFALELPAPPQS